MNINIDIKKIPFSYPGSYFTVHEMEETDIYEKGIYIKTLHKDGWRDRVIKFELYDGEGEVPYVWEAAPTLLTMKSEKGSFSLCFASPSVLAFEGRGVGLRMKYINASQSVKRDTLTFEINCCAQNERVLLKAAKGKLDMQYEWDGDNCTYIHSILMPEGEEAVAEGTISFFRDSGAICESRGFSNKYPWEISFEKAKESAAAAFECWMKSAGKVRKEYEKAYELANYLNWSSLVMPYGNLKRRTMFASKASMTGIWSWDHCFHALGVLNQDPELAWEQWMLMFDKQDEKGALPDRMDEFFTFWGFYKPPVHGYLLGFMLKNSGFITNRHLEQAYEPLKKWTDFWFLYCDSDQDGIPEYYNGNDSGWDNNTVAINGIPFESPDLSTYLYLQMEVLEDIAGRLGKVEEKESWRGRKDTLLAAMLKHFCSGGKLTACMSGSHEPIRSDSLLLYLPLLLGEKLPEEVRKNFIRDLKEEGRFLTDNGLATEALTSRYYEADGYWRGPVWAPSAFLISQGLIACGEEEFAEELMKRFCDMAAREFVMPENFDAITGRALRDPSIIWTACVFTVFASKYLL